MVGEGKTFGQTLMTDEVAEPSDIRLVVKAVEVFPADKIEGDVVHLIKPVTGYKQGHYYRHTERNGSWIWDDLGEPKDLGFDDAVGTAEIDIATVYYPILEVKWTDPEDNRWIKSEFIISDADRSGEQVLIQSFTKNLYQEGYRMTLPIPVEHIITPDSIELKCPDVYANAKYYIRTSWANGFIKYNELEFTVKDN